MSPLRLQGSTSGFSQIDAPAVAGDQTFTLPGTGGTIVTTAGTQTLTNKTVQGGTNTLATAVASTSGTSIDFTGIPSWVNRITVMFNGVSLSGTANFLIQLGTGGTPTSSGYTSTSGYITTPNGVGEAGGSNLTSGFVVQSGLAAYAYNGSIVFTNISGNAWVGSGVFSNTASVAVLVTAAGSISLAGTLNMLRITNTSTNTFDAGTINILYEG